jgi:hypothetical protein
MGLLAAFLLLIGFQTLGAQSAWTIYITNDTCPDYTWAQTEEQTRQSLADLVRAHLDEMSRTDQAAPENRDRYNMAATNEALCFLERYPQRKEELIRRIKEGRITVSPFLVNSLWSFLGVEGAIRMLYPARRMERDWGIPIDIAQHIEMPSLPWGAASILSGCGVRWLSVPFLDYDSTFKALQNPPLFLFEGPDGARIRVVMDRWASGKDNYVQGSALLKKPERITGEWVPHYEALGTAYPLRGILASGTHGDISLKSADRAGEFADSIAAYNQRPGPHPKLINASLADFCHFVDRAEAQTPFLTAIRGSFGDSWELWPVSLAKYVADLRAGERRFLTAEALISAVAAVNPEIADATRTDREQAERDWTMLGDHAWNGANDANRHTNAELRRRWSESLLRADDRLLDKAWRALALSGKEQFVTLFNSLSFPRRDVVRMDAPAGMIGVEGAPSQFVVEDGRKILYALSPPVAGFGFESLRLAAKPGPSPVLVRATPTELEGPFFRIHLDPQTGAIANLIHKPTNTQLLPPGSDREIGQTLYFDGQDHTLEGVRSEVVAVGPVLGRVRIIGTVRGIVTRTLITLYAGIDRVDFEFNIHKPVTTVQERLVHVFPVWKTGMVERLETTGAIIRPYPQPRGDLLPGANPSRFAVQNFVDVSYPGGPGVTIATVDAYALRPDLGSLTFEALGNDQNFKEVTRDQNGETEFRFRYSLRAHAGGYDNAETVAWSHAIATPLLVTTGKPATTPQPAVALDPRRAVATTFKPAEAGGNLLRIQETAGRSGPLQVTVTGYREAILTDLLERDIGPLPIREGHFTLELKANGFAAVRLKR